MKRRELLRAAVAAPITRLMRIAPVGAATVRVTSHAEMQAAINSGARVIEVVRPIDLTRAASLR